MCRQVLAFCQAFFFYHTATTGAGVSQTGTPAANQSSDTATLLFDRGYKAPSLGSGRGLQTSGTTSFQKLVAVEGASSYSHVQYSHAEPEQDTTMDVLFLPKTEQGHSRVLRWLWQPLAAAYILGGCDAHASAMEASRGLASSSIAKEAEITKEAWSQGWTWNSATSAQRGGAFIYPDGSDLARHTGTADDPHGPVKGAGTGGDAGGEPGKGNATETHAGAWATPRSPARVGQGAHRGPRQNRCSGPHQDAAPDSLCASNSAQRAAETAAVQSGISGGLEQLHRGPHEPCHQAGGGAEQSPGRNGRARNSLGWQVAGGNGHSGKARQWWCQAGSQDGNGGGGERRGCCRAGRGQSGRGYRDGAGVEGKTTPAAAILLAAGGGPKAGTGQGRSGLGQSQQARERFVSHATTRRATRWSRAGCCGNFILYQFAGDAASAWYSAPWHSPRIDGWQTSRSLGQTAVRDLVPTASGTTFHTVWQDATFVLPARAQTQALIMQFEQRFNMQLTPDFVWDPRIEDQHDSDIVVVPRCLVESNACPAFQTSGTLVTGTDVFDEAGRQLRVDGRREDHTDDFQRSDTVQSFFPRFSCTEQATLEAHRKAGSARSRQALRAKAKVRFLLPVQTIPFCPADRLSPITLSQRVQPSWACTAIVQSILRPAPPPPSCCPAQPFTWPAGPGPKVSSGQPSMIGDLQAMIASHVPLSPDWIRGPLVHMRPFESRWLSAHFPADADKRRFSVIECRLDHLSRGARPEWSLLDYVYAALRTVTYRVKAVWFIVRPIPDLPVPQLVLTAANAPPGHRALPIDLRPLGGLLHTIEAAVPGELEPIWAALREKGVDPAGRLEQAWRDGLCVFADQFDQPVTVLRNTEEPLEWLLLRVTNPEEQAGLVVDYLGGAGAVLRVPAPVAPPTPLAPTTRTTTAARPVTFHGQALSVAEIAIQPADLAGIADRATRMSALPGLRYFLKERMPEQRHYTLFERTGHLHVRPLADNWCLDDLVRDVMTLVPMLRSIQILHSPLDRLPILQVVATDLGWPQSSAAVPFDLRSVGLSVCTFVIGPGLSQRTLHEVTWDTCANSRSSVPESVPFVDVQGHDGETRNPITEAQFYIPSVPAACASGYTAQGVATEDSEGSLSPQRAALLPCAPSTTTTTGAVQWAGTRITQQGVNRTADFLIARHVQLAVFTAHSVEFGPHSPVGTQLADALAPLLAQVLQRGHGPRLGFLQASRVLPLNEDATWLVPIMWAERTGAHVHVVLDTRCGGGNIQLLTLPIGTTADQVLPFNLQSQGWSLAVNGVGASSLRRPLESGDMLLLSRPGKPVPGFHFGHAVLLMPHLRVLTLPISLVDARPIPQQLTPVQSRDNAAILRDELLRHIQARVHLMGSAGPGLTPVTVMGLHHGPILLYLPGPNPTATHAQIVLDSIPEFPSGLTVYESDAFLGEVGVFVTAEPDAGTITSLVASTVGYGLDNLIVVALLPTQHQLGAAVYMDPFYTTEPFDNPRQGHYIRRTRISLPGDGLALACVNPAPPGNRQQRSCERAKQLGLPWPNCPSSRPGAHAVGHALHPPAAPGYQKNAPGHHALHARLGQRAIPTPLGRRTLPVPAGSTRTPIVLESALPAIAENFTELRLGTSSDMLEAVYGDFTLQNLCAARPPCHSLPKHVAQCLYALPEATGHHVSAMQLYVDGSYFPCSADASAKAGWAICLLTCEQGVWKFAGYVAVAAPIEGSLSTIGLPVASSFEPELAAIARSVQ